MTRRERLFILNDKFCKRELNRRKQLGIYDMENSIDFEKQRQKVYGSLFVNTYECNRALGGREEGGWWYDYGEPIESVYFDTYLEAKLSLKSIRDKWMLRNKEEDRKHPSSVSCDGYYKTYIQTHYASSWSNYSPWE